MVVTININIEEDQFRELYKLIKNLHGGIEVATESEIETEKRFQKA